MAQLLMQDEGAHGNDSIGEPCQFTWRWLQGDSSQSFQDAVQADHGRRQVLAIEVGMKLGRVGTQRLLQGCWTRGLAG